MPSSSDFKNEAVIQQAQHSDVPLQQISIEPDKAQRQGIIDVVFNLDPNVMNWLANTFWDGKLSTKRDGMTVMVPNSEYYICPTCHSTKSTALNIPSLYQECRGSKENPHPVTVTVPLDWHPIGSRTGVSFLVGQLHANINPNIQTGNYGKSTTDVVNKADLDSKFTKMAVKTAEAIVASFLSNANNFAPGLLEDKSYERLPQVFNVAFLTTIITEVAINLLASYTKGKNMAAVAKILETRAHIEQEIMNRSERSATEEAISRSGNALGNLFSFGKPPGK